MPFWWLREHENDEFYSYSELYEFLDDAGVRDSATATEDLADELFELEGPELRIFKKAYDVARSMGKSRKEAEQTAREEAGLD